MWTLEKIKELRSYAQKYFGTELPISEEILKLSLFLEQSNYEFKRDLPKIERVVKYTLRWLPNFWTSPMDIEIPKEVMDSLRSSVSDLLEQRCDTLAQMCGYQKED